MGGVSEVDVELIGHCIESHALVSQSLMKVRDAEFGGTTLNDCR